MANPKPRVRESRITRESRMPNPESHRNEREARGRQRWVINKVRALGSWYTKGLESGSHLRTAINGAESVDHLREIISTFFCAGADFDPSPCAASSF